MNFKAIFATSMFMTTTAFAGFYVENGNIMAEVQTYKKNNKNIVLIDMIHVAPKDFYKGVNKLLKSYKSSSPVILQEGVRHCEAASDTYFVPGTSANFAALEKLYKGRAHFDTASAEGALKLAGFEKRKCINGANHSRPGIIDRFSSRFSLYGIIAGIGFVRSQGSVSVYPRGMKLDSGDIASARFENPISKALAGSVVECMLSMRAEGGCALFKEWAKTPEGEILTEKLILDIRNDVLLGATFNAMGISSQFGSDYNFSTSDGATYDTVLLPWGAAHMPGGLLKDIESMGFKKTAKSGIKYTDCERVKRNIILSSILSDDPAVKEGCKL